jgi:hypothetical protein
VALEVRVRAPELKWRVGPPRTQGGTVGPAQISASSLEYVRVQVAAFASGVAVNPTSDTVTLAFMSGSAVPASGDWKTGSWDTDSTTTPATYRARCLVGTGGAIVLTPGIYAVWVKVTDAPETPVKQAGALKVV